MVFKTNFNFKQFINIIIENKLIIQVLIFLVFQFYNKVIKIVFKKFNYKETPNLLKFLNMIFKSSEINPILSVSNKNLSDGS